VGKVGGSPNRQQDSQTPFLRRASLYIYLAFEIPGTILGGLLAGYFLDNYLGTSPWFLIAVTVIAFAGAFMRLLKFARERDGRQIEKDDTAH
jgi:F0F1-type ATP synthase assembly protein I